MNIFKRVLLSVALTAAAFSAAAAPLPAFNPGLTYTTATDIQGSIFAYQGGYYYDQQGNAWVTIPKSQNGYTAVAFPAGSTGTFTQKTIFNLDGAVSPMTWVSDPVIQITSNRNNYAQTTCQNLSAGAFSSCDFIAYNNLATTDTSGYMDMGIEGSGFNQGAFNVTQPYEGYILMSALAGSSSSGDMVLATDSTGTSNNIRLCTGGLTSVANCHVYVFGSGRMSLFSATDDGVHALQVTGSSIHTGVVTAPSYVSNVATGTAPFTVISTTAVANLNIGGNSGTATNVAAGTANQIPYQTGAGVTSFFSAANYGVPIYGATGVPSSIAGAAGVLVGSASAIPSWSTAINGVSVGATTPSTGAFTTLSSSGATTMTAGTVSTTTGTGTLVVTGGMGVSGSIYAGFVNAVIGQGAANAGTFTSVAASGLISPTGAIGIKGNALGTAMQAGSIGETMTATGTAVALTTATTAQIATVSPTIGSWDIFSECTFNPAASTTSTITQAGTHTTTAVLPAAPLYTLMPIALAANTSISYAVPTQHVTIGGTTPYYVNAQATFAVSTMTATCTITAVRTN
jgi:hypothetical protein